MVTVMATQTQSHAPSAFQQALHHAGVVWGGLFALGVGFGVLVVDHGYPWWLAPLISLVVFAGSMEFILIGMTAAAAPLSAIAVTTFLVNSRHLFYGLSFPLQDITSKPGKLYSMFGMIDEAYALVSTTPAHERSQARTLITQVGLHMGWVSGSMAGAIAGTTILGGVQGLDFVLIALFIVLTLDAWNAERDPLTLILAAAAGAIGVLFGQAQLLLIAMAVFTGMLIVRHGVVEAKARKG